jgi:hypothetical protein
VTRAASAQERDVAAIEAQLAAEGLAPLDAHGNTVSNRDVYELRDADSAAAARDEYLAWARDVLVTERCFRGHRSQRSDARAPLREVWGLHAAGRSNGEISRALGCSREAVKKALRRVAKRAPPPPVVNPWRKSGRDEALYERANMTSPRALARLCKLAIDVAGINEVREAIGNDKQLMRLLPRERTAIMSGTDEKKTAPKAFTTYSIIELTEPLKVPGVSVRKAMLIDMEARQHAGGMDVVLTSEGGEDTIVTIPWHQIKLAKRPSSAA